MRSSLPVLLLLSWLSLPAVAAEGKEQLVLPPYPGETPWKEVTNVSSGMQSLREQIPADEDIDSYKDILTAQSFPQHKGTAPSTFLKGMFSSVAGACRHVRVNGPVEHSDGGYPVAYAQIYCGQQNGKPFGVRMFFKVIQGHDALYVIQRESRVPVSEVAGVVSFDSGQAERMQSFLRNQAIANRYLTESVYLCGEGATDARCAAR